MGKKPLSPPKKSSAGATKVKVNGSVVERAALATGKLGINTIRVSVTLTAEDTTGTAYYTIGRSSAGSADLAGALTKDLKMVQECGKAVLRRLVMECMEKIGHAS